MRSLFSFLCAAFGSVFLAPVASACPLFSDEKGPTLVADFKQADMVVVGTFIKSRRGKYLKFESDFKITEVIKPHPFLRGKTIITLPKYQASTNPFVVYMDLFNGELDAYRAHELVGNSGLLQYLKGAVALAHAPPGDHLRFAFKCLQSDDFDVSLDAYREFAQAAYGEYRDMAGGLPADTIAGWLADPKTDPSRHGLYAVLLGHAGAKEPEKYAKVLRSIIDKPGRNESSSMEGLLAGHAMLEPVGALKYIQDHLADPKEDFLLRYGCLRAVRFFWEQRPDLFPEKDIVHSMVLVVRAPDMSDFAIEDLRRWNLWDATPAVLGLFEQKTHDTKLIKLAILRFALHAKAQGVKQATEFVERQDQAWVRAVIMYLEREEDDLYKPWKRAQDETPVKGK
jgi:hypothetical protein